MFTSPPSPYVFTAVTGHFLHGTVDDPSSLPALPDNLGLVPGKRWSELKAELSSLNEEARKSGSGASYKLVWAARHGEGVHNVAEAKYGTAAWDAKWACLTGDGSMVWGPDPPLTSVGEGQALDAAQAWKATLQSSDPAPLPTALFASPLARSAHTAALSFEGTLLGAKGAYEQGGKLARPPLILEGLRENFADRHTCDERSVASVVGARWRGWKLDEGIEEADDLFVSKLVESAEEMSARVADALADIWARTKGDEVISVTSHSGTMQALFRAIAHPDFKPATGGLVPLLIKATPKPDANAATLGAAPAEATAAFAPGLLEPESEEKHRKAYAASKPYKHAVVQGLLDDALLKQARIEIEEELRFTEKETDIYKVNQTGDLANLDGLPAAEVARLQSVLRVRNAIYSAPFRAWLQGVTGCGPLSAKNKDMSINDYRSGCHLLNHDDVISTRRLSYILYLPDPSQEWRPEWGGALELYPTVSRGVPADTPSVVIPPRWNQYTFFTVQPGHSFHSVEEVVHPTHSRLSISGWFHRPAQDEEGYSAADEKREEEERKAHASAEGLSSKEATQPFHAYAESLQVPLPGSPLSAAERQFLAHFLNAAYLQPATQAQLFERFGDDSHILLADVLRPELAQALEKLLIAADGADGLRWWESGTRDEAKVPAHTTGTSEAWKIVGPPHRQRYLSLQSSSSETPYPSPSGAGNASLPSPFPTDDVNALLGLLRTHLLPSPAFRHFLANITQLVPLATRPIEARRFRPGLDYTLARADAQPVLDVCLGLTPSVAKLALDAAGGAAAPRGLGARAPGKAKRAKVAANNATLKGARLSKKAAKELAEAWESGDVGGWEAYMAAPEDEDDDPAVYGSGTKKPPAPADAEGEEMKDGTTAEGEAVEEDDEEFEDEEEEDEFDGVLLNLVPSWNTLSVALRDPTSLRFTKYLSASAGGSRWDCLLEAEVGAVEEEEEEE